MKDADDLFGAALNASGKELTKLEREIEQKIPATLEGVRALLVVTIGGLDAGAAEESVQGRRRKKAPRGIPPALWSALAGIEAMLPAEDDQ
jgi:hypothetical protein